MPKKKNPANNYFNQAVEEAVCTYLSSDDDKVRNEVFKLIYPAFCKIAQVMFNKMRLTYFDDDPEDVQANCVAFMVEKLPKFKCNTGSKAFSYFTVVAKFYLIQENNKNYRVFQKVTPLSHMDEKWDVEDEARREEEKELNSRLYYDFLMYCEINFEQIFDKLQQPYAKKLLSVLNSFEHYELNRRKILKVVENELGDRHKLAKTMLVIQAQFNLFKERFDKDIHSFEYIKKDELSEEDKLYIRSNLIHRKQSNGTNAIARKLGLPVKIVREYVKTI